MNSVVFRDATVIDGSGAPPFRATVRVDGNRISSITIGGAAPGRTDPATATEAQSVPDGAEIVRRTTDAREARSFRASAWRLGNRSW